jgi:hypothetical protein
MSSKSKRKVILSRRSFLISVLGMSGIFAFGLYSSFTNNGNAVNKRRIFKEFINNSCQKYNKEEGQLITSQLHYPYKKDSLSLMKNILNGEYENEKELNKHLQELYKDDYSNEKILLFNNWVLSETEAFVCYQILTV